MKKKIAAAASAALFCILLAACGTGPAAHFAGGLEAEHLIGRWHLAELHVAEFDRREFLGEHTFRPGDAWWMFSYFVEFGADGTFTELNFWTPEFGAAGAWSAGGGALTLALKSADRGSIPFVGSRAFSVSPDGGALTITYSRTMGPYSWDYTATFARAARLDGYGGGRAGPLIGAWGIVDIIDVPLEFVLADEVEFLADGTGHSFFSRAHMPPGAMMPFASFDEERDMFVSPFAWGAENGRVTMEGSGLILAVEYDVSGAVMTLFYDWGPDSRSVYERLR